MFCKKSLLGSLVLMVIVLTGCANGSMGQLAHQQGSADYLVAENGGITPPKMFAPSSDFSADQNGADAVSWPGKVVFCSEY